MDGMKKRCLRPGGTAAVLLRLWWVVALGGLTGCSTFYRDWEQAATVVPADGLAGRWEGTWQSDDSGHHDRLRCLITPQGGGMYAARFHAIYRQTITFGYTVPLRAEATNGGLRFGGEANLGWLAGGVYHYDGRVEGAHFFSTYSCKYDHGTFTMTRAPVVPRPPPADARQAVVVTTADWGAGGGRLQAYERADGRAAWRAVGPPATVVVGRNGLGWGRGVTAPPATPGTEPVKREGDGRSPAGVFRLTAAFGRAATPAVPGMKLPYRAETPGLDCVDDPASTHYNTLVDRGAVPRPDWNSAEHMLSVGDPYRLGVVVDHNPAPAVAGGGSCIFLHLWQGPGRGTSGCTAMADADLERLLGWLDPAAGPVLVQLPAQTYAARRKEWGLPPAPGAGR